MQIEATRAYAIAQASLGLMREGPARAEGHLASLDRMSKVSTENQILYLQEVEDPSMKTF